MLIWRDDTLDVIEPTPIDDTFITHLWQVEEAPGACLRGYFCSEEAGLYNLKTKFLIPVTCAAQMNMQAAGAITELMRKHPNFIGRKLLPMLLMVLL